MSDSDSDAAIPSIPDGKIEKALRDATTEIFEEDQDNLTLKSVRVATERKLKLEEGWFKAHEKWNQRSKEIVHSVAEELQNEPEDAPVKPKPVARVNGEKSASKKEKKAEPPKKGVKRPSPEEKPKAQKKRKVSDSEPEESDDLSEFEESEEEPPKPKPKPKPKKEARAASKVEQPKKSKATVEKDAEDEAEIEPEPPKPQPAAINEKTDTDAPKPEEEPKKEPPKPAADDSSSELSSLIDEPQPPKKKRQKKSPSPRPAKASKSKPRKSESTEPSDPNAEEIKRLQGWLVKCGIRKVWGKELMPYPTPREKITHLKRMLKDAGMDGRYSVEKARQIKEARELAADLEAVKDFDERWGKEKEEQESGGTRKRRAAKLLVDFSDDGEDSG